MSSYLKHLDIQAQEKHWVVLATMTPLEQENYLKMLDIQYKDIVDQEREKRQVLKARLRSRRVKSTMLYAFGLSAADKTPTKDVAGHKKTAVTGTNQPGIFAVACSDQTEAQFVPDGLAEPKGHKKPFNCVYADSSKNVRDDGHKTKEMSRDLKELSKEQQQKHMLSFLLKQQQHGYLTQNQVLNALNGSDIDTKELFTTHTGGETIQATDMTPAELYVPSTYNLPTKNIQVKVTPFSDDEENLTCIDEKSHLDQVVSVDEIDAAFPVCVSDAVSECSTFSTFSHSTSTASSISSFSSLN